MRVLPPHKYTALVNELRDTAVKYAGTQQLRAQISVTLRKYVQPEPIQHERNSKSLSN